MTIHFYGIHETYGYLSNFSHHPIELDGHTWPTTEHYFQAMKFPDNPDRQAAVRAAESPAQSKRVAWASGATLRPDWDTHRDEVMLTALRAKFAQHPKLREGLLSTGEERLVERSDKDSYWGDGSHGNGRNRLGELLMQVRAELREAAPTDAASPLTP